MNTEPDPALLSGQLTKLWQNNQTRKGIDPDLKPADRRAAYLVQARWQHHLSDEVTGWKIAATSEAGQKHINVGGPMAGRLYASQRLTDAGEVSLAGNNMRVVELEFAFCIGETIAPRNAAYTVENISAAVATVHPSIELPGSRIENYAQVGELALIADNACAHQFLVGPAIEDWHRFDFPRHRVRADTGRLHREGVGGRALGDPLIALTWLANELSGLGIPLEQGQIVMTGTCLDPVPVQAGDTVQADFGDLGQLSLRFID